MHADVCLCEFVCVHQASLMIVGLYCYITALTLTDYKTAPTLTECKPMLKHIFSLMLLIFCNSFVFLVLIILILLFTFMYITLAKQGGF